MTTPSPPVNFTHDGFAIDDSYHLVKCRWPEYYGWNGITEWASVFSIEREWNTERGTRKPYWSIQVLGFHLQIGWLWEIPA